MTRNKQSSHGQRLVMGTQGSTPSGIPADMFTTTISTAPVANSSHNWSASEPNSVSKTTFECTSHCPSLQTASPLLLWQSELSLHREIWTAGLLAWSRFSISLSACLEASGGGVINIITRLRGKSEKSVGSGSASESTQNEQLQCANGRDVQPLLQTREQLNFKASFFKSPRETSN